MGHSFARPRHGWAFLPFRALPDQRESPDWQDPRARPGPLAHRVCPVQQAQTGQRGPTGPPGATGPASSDSVQWVTATWNVPSSNAATIDLGCPSGTHAVSAVCGAQTLTASDYYQFYVHYSGPNLTGGLDSPGRPTRWQCKMSNLSKSTLVADYGVACKSGN